MAYVDRGPFFQKAPKDIGHVAKKKGAKVIWKLRYCWEKVLKIAKWGLPSQGNGRLAQIYIPPTYLWTD